MRTWTVVALTVAIVLSTCLAALAANGTFYRACCVDEPERHGCGISNWYSTSEEADGAGARHEQATFGHQWTVETIVRP
jgi:hypothetical protein